ncbi:MAG: tyrosine-type recombinase/integrase [Sulfuricaulis sp.]
MDEAPRIILLEWADDLRDLVTRIKKLRRRVGSVYLFANRQGQAYTTSGFDSMWQRLMKKCKIKGLHFHDLRAWAVTKARELYGRDYAQDLAAHEDGSTTEGYIRGREIKRVRALPREF